MATYIEDIAGHVGETVTLKGWLHNRRSSGKLHFLTVARRHGLHPGGDVEGRCRPRGLRLGRSSRPGERHRRDRRGARRCARAGRLRARRQRLRGREPVARLPDHAEGARRRLPDGPPPPVDPRAASSTRSCASGTRSSTPAATSSTPAASSSPTRRSSRPPPARARRRSSRSSTSSDDHRLPHAERSALQRGECDGARPRLRVRSDVPRREVEDAPAPHRVLDGRARDGLRVARRHDGPRRGPDRVGRLARARQAGPRTEDARARHLEARVGQATVPAHHLRRGGREAARRGTAVRVGRRLRRAPTRR